MISGIAFTGLQGFDAFSCGKYAAGVGRHYESI